MKNIFLFLICMTLISCSTTKQVQDNSNDKYLIIEVSKKYTIVKNIRTNEVIKLPEQLDVKKDQIVYIIVNDTLDFAWN